MIMAVEKQNKRSSDSQHNNSIVATSVTMDQINRNMIGSWSKRNSEGLSEILLEDAENEKGSLLNFAVMENACLVTRKRRSRNSCAEASSDDVVEARPQFDCLESIETSSENFLVMEKAYSAIRRRRSKYCEDLDDKKYH